MKIDCQFGEVEKGPNRQQSLTQLSSSFPGINAANTNASTPLVALQQPRPRAASKGPDQEQGQNRGPHRLAHRVDPLRKCTARRASGDRLEAARLLYGAPLAARSTLSARRRLFFDCSGRESVRAEPRKRARGTTLPAAAALSRGSDSL